MGSEFETCDHLPPLLPVSKIRHLRTQGGVLLFVDLVLLDGFQYVLRLG